MINLTIENVKPRKSPGDVHKWRHPFNVMNVNNTGGSALIKIRVASFITLIPATSRTCRRSLEEVHPVLHRRPGVNFINVLWAAFMLKDPKSANHLLDLTVFFALLGSAHVKAACRTLIKFTPGGLSWFLLHWWYSSQSSRGGWPALWSKWMRI